MPKVVANYATISSPHVAIKATDGRSVSRYIQSMENAEGNEYVRRVLALKDWDQADLARRLSHRLGREYDRSKINKIVLGKRRVQVDEILAIEEESGIPSPTPSAGIPVPLISWVSAGKLVVQEGVTDLEMAPKVWAPGLDPKGDWIALQVDGDSMDRISPPESIIFVNRADKRLVSNACYVVVGDDGAATYKRFRHGNFEPVSTNQKHKALKLRAGVTPKVIGRVRKSVLSM